MISYFHDFSPGSGGPAADGCGGGGGGVMVDGQGPTGGRPQHGEGYGAGGDGCYRYHEVTPDPLMYEGYSGVVILDFI